MEDLEVQAHNNLWTAEDMNKILNDVLFKDATVYNNVYPDVYTQKWFDYTWDFVYEKCIQVIGVIPIKQRRKSKLYTYQGIIFDNIDNLSFSDRYSLDRTAFLPVYNYNKLTDTLVQFDLKERITENELYLRYYVK